MRWRKLHVNQTAIVRVLHLAYWFPLFPFPDSKFIHFRQIFCKCLPENLDFFTCTATWDPWLQQSPPPSPNLSPSQVEPPRTTPEGRIIEQQIEGSSWPLRIPSNLIDLIFYSCQDAQAKVDMAPLKPCTDDVYTQTRQKPVHNSIRLPIHRSQHVCPMWTCSLMIFWQMAYHRVKVHTISAYQYPGEHTCWNQF